MNSESITPWNPSRRAVARVRNPLPLPKVCPHCSKPCGIVNNSVIYGREYGDWPWAVLCSGCKATVGLHPFTGIPLGTLATAPMREARKRAKAAFNPLWQSGCMTRTQAYAWLAQALGIANVEECHIGWFDVAQCDATVAVVEARAAKLNKAACEVGREWRDCWRSTCATNWDCAAPKPTAQTVIETVEQLPQIPKN